jgi:hypothetical protein
VLQDRRPSLHNTRGRQITLTHRMPSRSDLGISGGRRTGDRLRLCVALYEGQLPCWDPAGRPHRRRGPRYSDREPQHAAGRLEAAGIGLHQKDLNLALQGARGLGVSLPNIASCQELFNAALAAGGATWDHSGIVRVLERLACHEIGQPVSMMTGSGPDTR